MNKIHFLDSSEMMTNIVKQLGDVSAGIPPFVHPPRTLEESWKIENLIIMERLHDTYLGDQHELNNYDPLYQDRVGRLALFERLGFDREASDAFLDRISDRFWNHRTDLDWLAIFQEQILWKARQIEFASQLVKGKENYEDWKPWDRQRQNNEAFPQDISFKRFALDTPVEAIENEVVETNFGVGEGMKIYYHGTTADNAIKLLQTRIDLRGQYINGCDFSYETGGFYVGKSLKDAVDWGD